MTTRVFVLFGMAAPLVIGLWNYGPIPQWQDYHRYADARALFGIPNFIDVFTNLAFLLVGGFGLWVSSTARGAGALPELRHCYQMFFVGVALVAFGSIYYHLAPDDSRLVWDRLPMTISFMALTCIVLGEQIDRHAARRALWPALLIGIAAVIYWAWSESRGVGDLRPYALVQGLPMVWIPLALLLFPTPFDTRRYLAWLIGLYLLAKLAELYDGVILDHFGISGHSLKHLLAAAAAAMVILAIQRRRSAE